MKIWFQNRRMKWRNSKERELLASGGSRDQTLPNKNNPNPDLSDARNDRPPSLSPPSSPNIGNSGAAAGNGIIAGNSPTDHDQYINGTSPSQTPQKLMENKFQPSSDTLTKFDMRKSPNEQIGGIAGTGASGATSKDLFKYEFDENRQGQIFTNFYDKLRDSSGSIAANYGMARPTAAAAAAAAVAAANNNINMNLYYDEYDSHSDTDEEISVT